MTSPNIDTNKAPDYIKDFIVKPEQNGAADLLLDGAWCGHGEELYRVYDVLENGDSVVDIELPESDSEELFPAAVRLRSLTNQKQFLIYDTRHHPASMYAMEEYAKKETIFSHTHRCAKCEGTNFKVSVGFEVPEDSGEANDTSWFALATECVQCGDKTIAYEDETA